MNLLEENNEFIIHDSIADQFIEILFLSGACGTEPVGLRESIESLLYGYEITPRPEPVYEYQWVLEIEFMGEIARTRFMTIVEHDDIRASILGFQCDESTKRERK